MTRQIVLDTETTGLSPKQGHRIIEIGCVELENRRLTGEQYHTYIRPERKVDPGAFSVHGISDDFLADKPVFSEIIKDFLAFVDGAELIIHNATFDVGFLNHEFSRLKAKPRKIDNRCQITDTLALARRLHPGQKNNLDALCKRYGIDNSSRDLHGALLDAQILSRVYLMMTGGQDSLFSDETGDANMDAHAQQGTSERVNHTAREPLPILAASVEEAKQHLAMLKHMQSVSKKKPVWEEDEIEA